MNTAILSTDLDVGLFSALNKKVRSLFWLKWFNSIMKVYCCLRVFIFVMVVFSYCKEVYGRPGVECGF